MGANGQIPVKSTDCCRCHSWTHGTSYRHASQTAGAFCSDHPDGKDYEGHERYEPSDWVKEVVGKKYRGPFNEGEFECTGYDIRIGFWMRDTNTQELRNVSERAISRTFHPIRRPFLP